MNIETRSELKKILKEEKEIYLYSREKYQKILLIIKNSPKYRIWKYVRRMRITSYYYSKRKVNILYSIGYMLSYRLFNNAGAKLGIESGENVFGKKLRIFHSNGIVINGNAKVGDGCRLYGNNCIGNDGLTNACPKIGNNVRLCVGAKVLGNVTLADNIVVAAGSIVTKSCLESNVILAGIPAKIIKRDDVFDRYLD